MTTMKGFSKAAYRQIWFDRIRAMRQSGLSQKAFAERESLQPWQLADWVRRFNQAAAESVDAAQKSFIPVQLSSDLKPSHAVISKAALQLSLANGILLSCDPLPDPTWLTTVLRALHD